MSPQIFASRGGCATITVLDRDGSVLANRDVTVEQTAHKFLFGTTGFTLVDLANGSLEGEHKAKIEEQAERLTALFNCVTLPFYWGLFEPVRGQPITGRMLKTARWFVDRGLKVKGHPLAWHSVHAKWLLDLSNAQIIEAQRQRIYRDVADFKGLIDLWDVINEVVIMPIFDKYDNGLTRICREMGRIGVIRMTFDAARKTNPSATLLLNDFDMSAAFECLIEGVLEAGIKIDAIGLQSHMHQGYWGVEKTQTILERFARYGLPLHFTESTLVSGKIMPPEIVDLNDYQVDDWPTTPDGEARQAEEVKLHYQTLVAHPQVEAITWWGLEDGGWLKAPSGLLRADQSAKPAYHALKQLIKNDWWLAPTPMRTDDAGRVNVSGFLGDYALRAGNRSAPFSITQRGASTISAQLA